ncbi:hypothetical protein GOV09_06660 [Candidatus Woesearchaeota archaeon]|nr:hypothetical protein [Candidatus Woesearchaeota archaeon]
MRKIRNLTQIEPKYEFYILYGTMLGDGCLSRFGKHHYALSISGHLTDDSPFLNKIAGILTKIRGKATPVRNRPKEGKVEINIADKELFTTFQNLGFPVGKKGNTLHIPTLINTDKYKYLIQGYFATDGCLVIANNNGIAYPRIEFSGISRKLLEQVLHYLIDIGMQGDLYVNKVYSNHYFTKYRLQFSGKRNLSVFISKIGFINPKHVEKYSNWKNDGGEGI